MGQIRLTGANAAKALETLVPVDIIDLPVGMQRYAMFTNDNGGILDDLMVANLGNDELFLVVNAACKDQDLAHLRKHIGDQCTIEPLFEERALLALQGPAAVKVLARLAPEVAKMTFMQFAGALLGVDCFVSRSGYTGEDGFEISCRPPRRSPGPRLLAEPEVKPSAWAPATRCAWKPACACTATT
jgi:aminomethyltransferase